MKPLVTVYHSAIFTACLAGAAAAQDTTTDAAPVEGTDAIAEVAEPVGTPPEGTIVMQDKNTMLAADMMGATVFNDDTESVGKIKDIIISLDGDVEGVVIGVGGFLGMGEKPVAISLEKISVNMTEMGDPQLVLAATRADLEAADDFITVQQQRAAETALQIQRNAESEGVVPADQPATQ